MTDRTKELLIELLQLSSSHGEANGKPPVTSTPIIWGRLPEPDNHVFQQCISALSNEPQLAELTAEEINEALWDLYLDVAINAHLYFDPERRDEKVAEFWTHLSKASTSHEVMFPVENLSLPEGTEFVVNGVEFRVLKEEEFDTRTDRTELGRRHFVNQSVAIVRLEARSLREAVQRARVACDTTLNLVRACLHWPPTRSTGFLWDFQLQFHRGEYYAIRDPVAFPTFSTGWELEFSPVNLELTPGLMKTVQDAVEHLDPVLSNKLHPNLRKQLERALDWIGVCPIQRSFDDKVLSLCTALECFLCTKDNPRKGAAISLNSMLLGRAARGILDNPSRIYNLYELRSRIVHGSEHRVASEWDYEELRRVTLRALSDTINYLASHSSMKDGKPINRVSRFLNSLRTRELLDLALLELSGDGNGAPREVVDLAKEWLGQQDVHGC